MIKTAIADDHPMMLEGLQKSLARYSCIALSGAYRNGKELLEGLKQKVPDVLLLDIQMPGQSGDELVPVLLKKYPDIKILIFTNFDSVLYANNLLQKGAGGYLLKTVEESVLIDAIKAVYDGEQFIAPELRGKLQQINDKIKKAVFSKFSLTPREKEILKLIADGNTCPEIASVLFLSIGTIENYRNTILLKLEAKNTAALVKKALQYGLI